MSYVRTVLAALNNDRKCFPARLAALDALLVTIATLGLLNFSVAAINFAGNRWQVGTHDLLGYYYMDFGSTADWTIVLVVIAIISFIISFLANDTARHFQLQRRSVVKTVLVVAAAVASLPGLFALVMFIGAGSIQLGDVIMLVSLFGLICVPAALTLTRPDPTAVMFGKTATANRDVTA